MVKANQDIRDYMADHGVTQKMLAKEVGTTQDKISKSLSKELSQLDKEVYLNLIDSIVAERTCGVAEDVPSEDITEEDPVSDSSGPKFQIGDRVKVPSRVGKVGTVVDIWISIAKATVMYAVEYEDDGYHGMFSEDQLELAPLPVEYKFEITIEDNTAVVAMIAMQGEKSWVFARGHAHILHDGEVGMAQAVIYASKRMFESIDRNQPTQIYFKQGGTEQ